MIRAVVFDLGDTLIRQVSDEAESLDNLELTLMPGAEKCLQTLAPLYKLAILSNTETTTADQLQAACLKIEIGALPISYFTSVSLGVKKPHPSAFLAVSKHLQLPPGEMLMVGNNLLEDIAGALGVGMWTIHIATKAEDVPIKPDLRISRLSSLTPELINAIDKFSHLAIRRHASRFKMGEDYEDDIASGFGWPAAIPTEDEEAVQVVDADAKKLMQAATRLETRQDFRRIGGLWLRCAAAVLGESDTTGREYLDEESSKHHFPTISADSWEALSARSRAARAYRYGGYHFESDQGRQSAYIHYKTSARLFEEDQQFDEAGRSYYLALLSYARRYGEINEDFLTALQRTTKICVENRSEPYLRRMIIYYRQINAILKEMGNHSGFVRIRQERLEAERKLLCKPKAFHRYLLWTLWRYTTGYGQGITRWSTTVIVTLGLVFPAIYKLFDCFEQESTFLQAVLFSIGRLSGYQPLDLTLTFLGEIVVAAEGVTILLLVAALVTIIVGRTSE